MQEINELKNLVIQSLEASGVLSQIRAQIRASVFKIIDNQENQGAKKSGFFWENPLCLKLHDSQEGLLALGILFDFLDAYRMDYTLNVFQHESNLREVDSREMLYTKLGLKTTNKNVPILMAMINKALNGDKESSASHLGLPDTAASGKPAQKAEPSKAASNIPEIPKFSGPKPAAPANKPAEIPAQKGVAQIPPFKGAPAQEEKKKDTKGAPVQAGKPQQQQQAWGRHDDNYEDEEPIEEIEVQKSDKPKPKMTNSQFQESDEIGASQSQGFDVTVDSMQLEDYDYFEDVDKV